MRMSTDLNLLSTYSRTASSLQTPNMAIDLWLVHMYIGSYW